MNNILISDPFLFPPSGEDIFRGPFIPKNIRKYSEQQFEHSWEIEATETDSVKSYQLWPAVLASPTISNPTEEIIFDSTHPMDDQDSSWFSSSCFNLAEQETLSHSDNLLVDGNENPSPISFQVPIPPSVELPFEELDSGFLDEFLKEGESLKLNTLLEYSQQMDTSEEQPQDFINTIPIQQILFQEISNSNCLVNPADVSPEVTADSTTTSMSSSTGTFTSRSRRKVHQENRLASASPSIILEEQDITAVDIKPSLAVLERINGSSSTKRKQSITSEQSTSFREKKRIRKYELNDSQDISVKNAKAAKLNRDRKKQEFAQQKLELEKLKKELILANDAREKEKNELQQKLADSMDTVHILKQKLHEERERNLISNGLVGILTDAKKVLEVIVPPLSTACGHMDVSISDAFANIPVRADEKGNIISTAPLPTSSGSSFASTEAVSTYITFHISPQERMIKVDYDPRIA